MTATEGRLHIGHLIPLKAGRDFGVPDEVLHHDFNLAVQCEEHNLGLGAHPIGIQIMYRLLQIRIIEEMKRGTHWTPPEEDRPSGA
jgi:hypothetical protein